MKKHYTKILFIALFILQFSKANSQTVAIPDNNFVNWLNASGYSSCLSGNMLDTTCTAVISAITVNCKNSNIQNLDGIQYFDNLDTLICFSNPLSNLPSLPVSLKYLSCYSDSLVNLPALPNSLTYLNCSNNKLTSLPALADSLRSLACADNQLTYLPLINASLNYLDCSSNLLTVIPTLPTRLNYFNCTANQLSNLPVLSDSLKYLYCSSNQLTSLPVIPTGLIHLYCSNNLLTSIPSLPYNTLTELYCDHNQITSLQYPIPRWVTHLICDYNQLTTLPALTYNNVLNTVSCTYNLITSLPSFAFTGCYSLNVSHNLLPTISNGLHDFYYFNCSFNQLTTLPYVHILYTGQLDCSHNNLTSLGNPSFASSGGIRVNCSYNQLTSLPPLGNSIFQLWCNNNNLTSLPDLPLLMNLLVASNNPNLTCLPKLTTISQLQFANTAVLCLPNYGTISQSIPTLSSLPLCNIFNNNGCGYWWNINGKVYTDTNSNCVADANEIKLANTKINLYKDSVLQQQTYTGGEGLYSFDTDTGTYVYSVDTSNVPMIVTCPPTGFQTSVLTPVDSVDYNMNFGMQCKTGFDIGATSIVNDSGLFRPANFVKVTFTGGDISNFYGLHCALGVSGTVQIIFNGPISFFSKAIGSLTPLVSGDTLTYSVFDFGTINFYSAFKAIFQTDTSAVSGQQVCFTINVNPTLGDNNVTNNTLQQCFNVTESIDPNLKEVFPPDSILNTQQWLTYTIHFQNTGNATAQHIYILDTLDANLSESTFTLLSYSHSILTQVKGNVVHFNFPNINLPDSINDEPHSHGYVQFKIKLKDGLALGSTILNTAHIVFDFNAPVSTNTVINTISDCSQMMLANFSIPTTICKNEPLICTANIAFPIQIDWYLDSVFFANGLSVIFSNLSAGNHTVEMVASNSFCSQSQQQNLFIYEPPKPIIANSNDTLTSTTASTYQWYLNDTIISGATLSSYIANIFGWYSVEITDSAGCSVKSDSILAGCNHLATMTISSYAICPEDSIQVTVNPYLNTTWQWHVDSVPVSGSSSFYLSNLSSGNHLIELLASDSLCPQALSLDQNVFVWQSPTQPLINVNGDTLSSSAANGNQWFLNGILLTGANLSTYIIQQSGWFSVQVTDSNGCSSISDSVFVSPVGIAELAGSPIKISPNPFKNEIQIVSDISFIGEIVVTDIMNRIIFKNRKLINNVSIPTATWSNGIYSIKIISEGKIIFKKMVRE